MESLKPEIVRREQKRKGVKHRRHRRKTAAYIRQGEWFFLPRPMMHVGDLAVRNGQLVRGAGKPHRIWPGERWETVVPARRAACPPVTWPGSVGASGRIPPS